MSDAVSDVARAARGALRLSGAWAIVRNQPRREPGLRGNWMNRPGRARCVGETCKPLVARPPASGQGGVLEAQWAACAS